MSNKIRTTSIRIISLISSIMVLISALIFPAVATSNAEVESAYQPTWVDLMDIDYEYEMQAYKDGVLKVTQYMRDPLIQANVGGYDIHFIWGDMRDRSFYDYTYIGLQFPVKPVSVKFNNVSASLVGSSDGMWFYKIGALASNAQYDLFVDLGSNTGELKLISCFGIIDDTTSIESVNLKTWGQLRSDGQFYMQTFFDSSVSVPYLYNKEFVETSPSVRPDAMYLEIIIPVSIPYADSLSLTFLSPSIFPNDSSSTSLEGSSGVALRVDGNTVQALPYVVSHSTASSSYYGNAQYLQTVTIDLDGIEFNDNTDIIFRFYMSPIPSGYIAGAMAIYRFQVMRIGIKETTYSKPWYIRFFLWIQDEFTSLKQTINSAFGVGQAAPDRPDQEQQIQDQIQDNQQANDDLDNVIGELETAPTLPDFDDTGLDDFDTEVELQISPVQPVFVVIFENPVIFQMITYVFMFALGGFLLYGER